MKEDYPLPQSTTIKMEPLAATDSSLRRKKLRLPPNVTLLLFGSVDTLKYVDTFDRKDAPVCETRLCYKWVYNAMSSIDPDIRRSF